VIGTTGEIRERERKRVRDKLREGERGRMWNGSKIPSVQINPQNVSGSWDGFWMEFSIAMELQCLEISETGPMLDRKKSLILLNAIGREGIRALRTKEYDNLTSNESSLKYDQLVGAFFAHEETSNVKTKTFVSVSQLTGEHNHSHLRRVEELSCELPYFKAKPEYSEQTVTALNTAREEMSAVIATNGRKYLCLRKDLLGKRDLDWKSLEATVLSRGVAEESSALLEQPLSATIKEEIVEVKRRNYESRKCFSCNHPDHVASQCPTIQCYKCRGRGPLARDCNEHSLPREYEGYSRGRDNRFSRRRPASLRWNRSRDRSLSRCRYYRPRESSQGRNGSLNRDANIVARDCLGREGIAPEGRGYSALQKRGEYAL